MPRTSEKQSKLEQAFQAALESESTVPFDKSSKDEFEQGVAELLPKLFQESFEETVADLSGLQFNHYQVIEQIGSGGMGHVYTAHRNDGQFDKIVAIKVLLQHCNNPQIKKRFLQEKQILAQLRHPNIVPLLDAGKSKQGQEWFVLEFIKGDKIDVYCQKNQLTKNDIVDLMIQICDAVHFAHSQGIIHRDLKPANILIENRDSKAVPIILDFGIAHLDSAKDMTIQGHLMGTPGFMSPEQVRGEACDGRADIFSLGVLMHQLFSGAKAFAGSSAIEIHQKILHEKTDKIAKLIPAFPQDLQIIIDTCLQKKPENRYQSALKLKQDLENWKNGYPIQAQKESLLKVLWRAVQRNKWMAVLSASFVVFGLLFIIKYTYDMNQQRAAAIDANKESDDLFNFLLKDLHQELSDLGRIDLLQTVAKKNLQHLNTYNFADNSEDKIKYAESYRNVASVLAMQQNIQLAIDAYKRALELLQKLDDIGSFNDQSIRLQALTLSDLAGLHAKQGQLQLANQEHQQALSYAQKLKVKAVDSSDETLWDVIHPLSWNLMEQSEYKQAETLLKQAIKITRSALQDNKENKQWLTKKYKSLIAMGWYYIDMREINLAIEQYLRAMDTVKKMLKQAKNSVSLLHSYQKVNNQISYAYLLNKDYNSTVKYAAKGVELGEVLHIKAPGNLIYYRALSFSYTMLGNAYKAQKRPDLAENAFKKSLDITQEMAQASPDNDSLQNDLAIDSMNFADLLLLKGEKKQAEVYWQVAETSLQKIASEPDASIYYVDSYAQVLLKQGKKIQALPYLLRMKNTKGWPRDSFEKIVKAYQLEHSFDEINSTTNEPK